MDYDDPRKGLGSIVCIVDLDGIINERKRESRDVDCRYDLRLSGDRVQPR